MSRKKRRKSKPSGKVGSTQRANHLKAMALLRVAQQAWAANHRYKAVALLDEAVRREPANPEVLVELATACGKQRNYGRAETLLGRLLELSPRSAAIYRRVAVAYSIIDRPERAAECFTRSLELNRDAKTTVATLLDLAALHERSHQLPEARQAVDEALTRDPQDEQAHLLQATLDRRQGDTAGAESRFRDLLGNEKLQTGTRAQAGYELAQLLDGEKQYSAAFDALVATKKLLRPYAKAHLEQHQLSLQKNEELRSTLNRSHYDDWRAAADDDTPYRFAVLTSHPRSGTTLVEQVLDGHDELKSADEFDVFTQWVHDPIFRKFPYGTPILSVLEKVPAVVRQQARATYWQNSDALFAQPLESRMLLDKNPGMTPLLPMVNWAFPEMKMLIALRDPRDVLLSCFMQKVMLTPISACWLSLTDAAEYYACSMNTWLKVRELSTSPWIEFRYEDVVTDLEQHARKILAFLDLPWDDKVLDFHEHAKEKVVRSPTYKDVTKPVYRGSVGRWQNYATQMEPVLEKLAPFVEEFGYE